MAIEIMTERFLLRELTQDDATERYYAWLHDDAAEKYISASARTTGLADLRRYVGERIGREDVVFLGIFTKDTGTHIGNIKYEPVDAKQGYAIMGILIGEPAWRGKGVASEVLKASAGWLRRNRGIGQILLGVHSDNVAAIKAYEKVGFSIAETPYIIKSRPDQITMRWDIPVGHA
jgi:RimJ/RimL family protein N-acetyltransferase